MTHPRAGKTGLSRDEHRRRNREFCLRGSALPYSKLNEASAAQIRTDYATGKTTQRKLANRYGVHLKTIQNILNYTTWVHVK